MSESSGYGDVLLPEQLSEREIFGTRLSKRDGTIWLALAGELDVFTAPRLRSALRDAHPAGDETLVLDLRGLTFLDSSGLAVILGAHEAAARDGRQPVRLAIKGSHAVESLFETIGAAGYLELIDGPAALEPARTA